MKKSAVIAVASLVLQSCGGGALSLPADPIERAATCGVVAAASARSASGNVEAKLSFDQQGAILHPALLEGAAGEAFEKDRAAAVVAQMPQREAAVTSGEWDVLVPACAEAYPATQARGEIALPSDPLTAQRGCDALSDFLTTALRPQESDYIEELRAYADMERKLDTRIGSTQARRGESDDVQASQRAMAELVKLGPPMMVMRECLERFE